MSSRSIFVSILAILGTLIGCQVAHQAPVSSAPTPLVGVQEAVKDSHFYFVQLTDTHFGEGDHLARTKKAVDMINALPMDIAFVVHTGDIVNDGIDDQASLSDGLTVLKKLNMPIYYLPGNHDILPDKLDSTTATYKEKIGPLISSVDYQGVTFIFIFTEPLAQSFSANGFEPLRQLELCLQKIGQKPVIICHHTPSVEDFYRNRMHRGWKADVRAQWVKLINFYNVKAVLAGHFHRDEQHWLGNVPLFVSPAIAGFWGRQAAFRIYEYDHGKISYRTQYIR